MNWNQYGGDDNDDQYENADDNLLAETEPRGIMMVVMMIMIN